MREMGLEEYIDTFDDDDEKREPIILDIHDRKVCFNVKLSTRSDKTSLPLSLMEALEKFLQRNQHWRSLDYRQHRVSLEYDEGWTCSSLRLFFTSCRTL